MNWDRIEGNWKQFTGKVKEKWGKLTDDEIAQSTATASSSKARFKPAMGMRRIRCGKRSTTGSAACDRRSGDTRSACVIWVSPTVQDSQSRPAPLRPTSTRPHDLRPGLWGTGCLITFMAQSLTETRAKDDERRFEMTFVDASGQKQTISLPVAVAADLVPVLQSLSAGQAMPESRSPKCPDRPPWAAPAMSGWSWSGSTTTRPTPSTSKKRKIFAAWVRRSRANVRMKVPARQQLA